MDFAELSDALGNRAVWIYLSSVIVAVWEVATNTAFLEPSVLTQFLSPIAQLAGLDLLTPDVYRACLRKVLVERFLPLARMLRLAFAAEPLELEEHAADLFDPVSLEQPTHGFRINGVGTTVLSLSNLVTWVLTNGLRSPSGYGLITSLDRVRRFGVPFPATSAIFLQHVSVCDQVLAVTLDSVAVSDSLAAAHDSVNRIVDNWATQTHQERSDTLDTLTTFLDFWGIPFEPPAYSWMVAFMGPAPPPGGPIHVWPLLHIDIPAADAQHVLMGWADDTEDEEEDDSSESGDDDAVSIVPS